MYAAHSNEFVGAIGTNSILSPMGYESIVKTIRKGTSKVWSAQTQFDIHTIAYRFTSNIIKIPRPLELMNEKSYSMEHIGCCIFVSPQFYKCNNEFFNELQQFYMYMVSEGYFPYNFTILCDQSGKFCLLDFSQFGTVSRGLVKFKHLSRPIEIFTADKMYGILSFVLADTFLVGFNLNSGKIEVYIEDEEDSRLQQT